jgi:dihydrofolate synthase/folylpolyglutamate synthase
VSYLDARIGRGIKPGLERIDGLLELMTSPHAATPVVHVAGTNGKTTSVAMIAAMLQAADFRVGTFTSPHLHAVMERFTVMGSPLTEEEFVAAVADVAPFVDIYEAATGHVVSYFELTAAIAFQLFAGLGLDAAVVEVGLGGRWDATNVVDAAVSVITGIAMDHMSYLGDSIPAIAGEKVAIVKRGGTLVTGPLPPAAEGTITARVAEVGARWFRFGADFGIEDASLGVGGWHGTVQGIHATYEDVFVRLHGRHQLDHFATSLVACELFLDGPVSPAAIAAGEATRSPGRLEVVARQPLVIVDGAHNQQGLEGLAETLDGEFPSGRRVLVVGIRGDRDVPALLEPLEGRFDVVIATAAADEAAIPAADVAGAARGVFGDDVDIEAVTPVSQAVTEALARVGEEDAVVITGSLYVVAEARARFL